MIKEVNEAYSNLAYYCDLCGERILFPGTALAPGVGYCISGNTNQYETLLKDMRYFHICSNCIEKEVKPILEGMGLTAYKNADSMTKEEFDEIVNKKD